MREVAQDRRSRPVQAGLLNIRRKAEALRTILTPVIHMIASSAGCLSCQLLQSHENPTRFVILEAWDSIESHQAAVRDIPDEAFAEFTGAPTMK